MASSVKQNIDLLLEQYSEFVLSISENLEEATKGMRSLIDVFAYNPDRDTVREMFALMMQPEQEEAYFNPKILKRVKVKINRGLGVKIPTDEQIEILNMVDIVDMPRFNKAFEKALRAKVKEQITKFNKRGNK